MPGYGVGRPRLVAGRLRTPPRTGPRTRRVGRGRLGEHEEPVVLRLVLVGQQLRCGFDEPARAAAHGAAAESRQPAARCRTRRRRARPTARARGAARASAPTAAPPPGVHASASDVDLSSTTSKPSSKPPSGRVGDRSSTRPSARRPRAARASRDGRARDVDADGRARRPRRRARGHDVPQPTPSTRVVGPHSARIGSASELQSRSQSYSAASAA